RDDPSRGLGDLPDELITHTLDHFRQDGDPGLGCLKGCLVTVVILFVAGWLVWELSPLQDWIGTGKGYWDQLTDWFTTVTDWIGDLGGSSGG
ncbi:hypothetical protein ACWDVV_00290, partial [Streptomyces tendae]